MRNGPAAELRARLNPTDPLAIPTPGFPTQTDLEAWALTQDGDAIRDEALLILGEPGWPQQYAAMALLRALGVSVEGDRSDGRLRWVVVVDGVEQIIESLEDVEQRRQPQ